MTFFTSKISALYIVLLMCGIYWWYLLGFKPDSVLFSDTNLGLIFFRITIGLPFIVLAGLCNFKNSLTTLLKPSLFTLMIFTLLFFMSLDLTLRFAGVENRDAPIIHTLYLGLRIAIVIWIFGIRNFKVSHNQLLLVMIGYVSISVLLDLTGQIEAFQSVDFYSGYIEWLTTRYSGLSFNTNMFAGILLTIVSIHVLVNSHNNWKNISGYSLTILLIFIAISTKGRFGLIICGLLGIIWVDVYFNRKWSIILSWSGIILTIGFIVLSVRISIFPISDEAPYLNTQPSFYRLAHEPNFDLVLSSRGIGLSDFEQRVEYKQFVDEALIEESFGQINSANKELQITKPYTAPHSIFLSLPLDYGAGALIVFIIINVFMIWKYVQLFGFAVETQIISLTFARYFHQQMSIASWTLLTFELVFILYSEQNRANSI